jgi:cellulose synthase/poly-beta-1,6-N-acetylglucosamine synthase-like glycosyltransferase
MKNLRASVIICAHNEEKSLQQTLESVYAQDFPRDEYEVVVIDNVSTDSTAAIAKKLGASVVPEEHKGLVFAREKGARVAKGEIIAYTDADTRVPKDWLKRIISAFDQDPSLVGYGGTYRISSGPRITQFLVNHGMYYFYLVGKILTRKWVLIGPNMAFKASAFKKTGGFDTTVMQGEDIDICQKLYKFGKVKLEHNFYVSQSARRFEGGLVSGLISYGLNWPMKVFFHIDTSKALPDLR